MAGSRIPGPTCSYTSPVGVVDGTSCLAPSPQPGPLGVDVLFNVGNGARLPVTRMTHEEKMAEAIRRAYVRGLISDEVMRQLPSIEQLVIGIVVVGGVLAGLTVAAGAVASTGVGAVLEGIAAGIVLALAAVGIVSSAKQVIAGIETLMKFYAATRRAATYAELDVAGRDFATGVAKVGVGTIIMILSVLGARAGIKMGKGAISKWSAADGPPEEGVTPKREEAKRQPPKSRAQYRQDPRFQELSKDPQTGKPNLKSESEAETILQAEDEYPEIKNPRRPDLQKGEPNLDFKTDSGWVDVKTPEPSPYRTLAQQAQDIADKTKLYDPNVKVILDLNKLTSTDRPDFLNMLKNSGGDMSKILTVPR